MRPIRRWRTRQYVGEATAWTGTIRADRTESSETGLRTGSTRQEANYVIGRYEYRVSLVSTSEVCGTLFTGAGGRGDCYQRSEH